MNKLILISGLLSLCSLKGSDIDLYSDSNTSKGRLSEYSYTRTPDLDRPKLYETYLNQLCPGKTLSNPEECLQAIVQEQKRLQSSVPNLDQLFNLIKNFTKVSIFSYALTQSTQLKNKIKSLELAKNNGATIDDSYYNSLVIQLERHDRTLDQTKVLDSVADNDTRLLFGRMAIVKRQCPALNAQDFKNPDHDIYQLIERGDLTPSKLNSPELYAQLLKIDKDKSITDDQMADFKATIGSVESFALIAKAFITLSVKENEAQHIEQLEQYLKDYRFTPKSQQQLLQDLADSKWKWQNYRLVSELEFLVGCKVLHESQKAFKSGTSLQEVANIIEQCFNQFTNDISRTSRLYKRSEDVQV